MDPEMERLTKMVERTLSLTVENNLMLHKMRRAAAWGRFFSIMWWALIIGSSAAAYYYLQPYIQNIEHLYGQLQGQQAQAQTLGSEVQKWLGGLQIPGMPRQ